MVRHVRTEAGAKKYKLPIGSPIVARGIAASKLAAGAKKATKSPTPSAPRAPGTAAAKFDSAAGKGRGHPAAPKSVGAKPRSAKATPKGAGRGAGTKVAPRQTDRSTAGAKGAVTAPLSHAAFDRSVKSGAKSSSVLHDTSSEIRVVTFKDGTKAIKKSYKGRGPEVKRQVDATELASALAESIGISAPPVHRVNDHELYMGYVDGPVAQYDDRIHQGVIDRFADSEAGRGLGLFDLLINYDDRGSPENWAYSGGHLVPIDNDSAWEVTDDPSKPPSQSWFASPFTVYWMDGKQWKPNTLSAGSVTAIQARLEGMRAQFEARGRGEWLDFALARLAAIAAHSTVIPKG